MSKPGRCRGPGTHEVHPRHRLSSAGLYDAPRRAWLAAELAKADGAPVYLFLHHPPFDTGHALVDLIKLDDTEAFFDLLNGHDIRHMFFGHAHRTISGQWRGIPFSALPSLNHHLPLAGGAVETIYSDEFLHRKAAKMCSDEERGNWF